MPLPNLGGWIVKVMWKIMRIHQPVHHLLSTCALSSIPQTPSQSAVAVYPPRPFGPNNITPPRCDHLVRIYRNGEYIQDQQDHFSDLNPLPVAVFLKTCANCLVSAGIIQNPCTGMESLVVVQCFRVAANQLVGQAGPVTWRKSFPLHPKPAYMKDVKNDTVP
ncbi:hypothetical protein O181_047407 [Austropuccinia psidii MF-1]|uniref:Uncharacterized protein n=1 Tax=Austropuccinia psidii MF-1 TaxID=1389203 RepID=A0A9Q3DXR7_9BASI|nr:hypothetical protein [Austropuccinia psidii MF-1]